MRRGREWRVLIQESGTIAVLPTMPPPSAVDYDCDFSTTTSLI
jgi:hypothetical protein